MQKPLRAEHNRESMGPRLGLPRATGGYGCQSRSSSLLSYNHCFDISTWTPFPPSYAVGFFVYNEDLSVVHTYTTAVHRGLVKNTDNKKVTGKRWFRHQQMRLNEPSIFRMFLSFSGMGFRFPVRLKKVLAFFLPLPRNPPLQL